MEKPTRHKRGKSTRSSPTKHVSSGFILFLFKISSIYSYLVLYPLVEFFDTQFVSSIFYRLGLPAEMIATLIPPWMSILIPSPSLTLNDFDSSPLLEYVIDPSVKTPSTSKINSLTFFAFPVILNNSRFEQIVQMDNSNHFFPFIDKKGGNGMLFHHFEGNDSQRVLRYPFRIGSHDFRGFFVE